MIIGSYNFDSNYPSSVSKLLGLRRLRIHLTLIDT